ncbi:cytochrome c maturation protein CcmE [Actinopolyspora halophila]|uniref:cytochrome c maturation protein CcmE n=1 Tax=Actinopolyspora halophila TaxID=1850 RepID=UPI00037BE910|nr:cytochrome c maturation protein CcmE [Actinopolyspora halophila]
MKRYRLLVVLLGGLVVLLLGVLVFGNLNSNLVYYLKPQEALARKADFDDGRRFKLGGMVAPDRIQRTPGGLRFTVTGGTAPDSTSIPVVHRGAPAQLFRPGIGVVLEGTWKGPRFVSDTMMVRHDENYTSPKVDTGGARR